MSPLEILKHRLVRNFVGFLIMFANVSIPCALVTPIFVGNKGPYFPHISQFVHQRSYDYGLYSRCHIYHWRSTCTFIKRLGCDSTMSSFHSKVLRNTNYGHCGICESLHVVGNFSASLMVYYFASFTQTKYEHDKKARCKSLPFMTPHHTNLIKYMYKSSNGYKNLRYSSPTCSIHIQF